MLFSRISIEDNFDPVAIYKFYDLLSAEFSDMEIIWKSGIKNVFYGEDANSVKIKVNGKTLFIHNSTNNKGIISLANANGKVEFVLKAFEEAGFSVSEPDPGNSYIFLAIYTLLIGAVCTLNLNVIWLISSAYVFCTAGRTGDCTRRKQVWYHQPANREDYFAS
ncbi:MAG: hypothetical protein LBV71_20455 [Prevotella sp.]|jgi:hypothetical protein|nr:hypothetical protein [Prevotella sp.]